MLLTTDGTYLLICKQEVSFPLGMTILQHTLNPRVQCKAAICLDWRRGRLGTLFSYHYVSLETSYILIIYIIYIVVQQSQGMCGKNKNHFHSLRPQNKKNEISPSDCGNKKWKLFFGTPKIKNEICSQIKNEYRFAGVTEFSTLIAQFSTIQIEFSTFYDMIVHVVLYKFKFLMVIGLTIVEDPISCEAPIHYQHHP